MEQLEEFLKKIAAEDAAKGNFLGLLHILIGRTICKEDGTLISPGLTWRDVAAWLKQVRWNRDAAAELGLQPGLLPPRDRERFWYAVIARAGVDSPAAVAAGQKLAKVLKPLGYRVSDPPSQNASP